MKPEKGINKGEKQDEPQCIVTTGKRSEKKLL
jgi:hypothetical protein